MATEAPQPHEQQQKDPIQEARNNFNGALFAKDYNGISLTDSIITLQNALLKSKTSPEKTYHELSIITGQGADLAQRNEDSETAARLTNMHENFQLTYESFNSGESNTTLTTPNPDNYPPMTAMKGETSGTREPVTPKDPEPTASAAQPVPGRRSRRSRSQQ
jgi:hypothetical protein